MTSDALTQEALDWLDKVAVGGLFRFRVDADPHPQSFRAVVRGKHASLYKGKLYAAFMQECVRQLAKQRPAEPLDGDLVAVLELVIRKPKGTVKDRPSGDVDNLAKGVQDGLTQAGIWVDDDNLVSVLVRKRWAEAAEAPGVTIHIGRLPE